MHSLMQRWDGNLCTKRKQVLYELLEARKTTLLTSISTKRRVRTHVRMVTSERGRSLRTTSEYSGKSDRKSLHDKQLKFRETK